MYTPEWIIRKRKEKVFQRPKTKSKIWPLLKWARICIFFLFGASRLVFIFNTPDFVITPRITLQSPGYKTEPDPYTNNETTLKGGNKLFYRMTPEEMTHDEFKKTIMGYDGNFDHAPTKHRGYQDVHMQYWKKTDIEYYRNLYSWNITKNNASMVKQWEVQAARGPRNYAGEAGIFYFLLDPAAVKLDILKTQLTPLELDSDRCKHLKNFDQKYHINECCQTKPSDGSPTTQDAINSHAYSHNYSEYYNMWHRELFTGYMWKEEIRPWIYEIPQRDGAKYENGTRSVPICHFEKVNTVGFAHSVLNNLAIFFQSLFLFSFFRIIFDMTSS